MELELGPCLVTGAAGFLGRNLVRTLLERGCRVRALVHNTPLQQTHDRLACVHGDVRDPAAMSRACNGIDTVFHTAEWIPDSLRMSFECTGDSATGGCDAPSHPIDRPRDRTDARRSLPRGDFASIDLSPPRMSDPARKIAAPRRLVLPDFRALPKRDPGEAERVES